MLKEYLIEQGIFNVLVKTIGISFIMPKKFIFSKYKTKAILPYKMYFLTS